MRTLQAAAGRTAGRAMGKPLSQPADPRRPAPSLCAGTIAERGEEAVYKRAGILSRSEELAQPSGAHAAVLGAPALVWRVPAKLRRPCVPRLVPLDSARSVYGGGLVLACTEIGRLAGSLGYERALCKIEDRRRGGQHHHHACRCSAPPQAAATSPAWCA